jgi:hypothetical protein
MFAEGMLHRAVKETLLQTAVIRRLHTVTTVFDIFPVRIEILGRLF